MKICEANEQTLGGAKSEPIKFSLLSLGASSPIPFAALLLPHQPASQPASRFIRVSAARASLAGVRLRIYTFPYRDAEVYKKERKKKKGESPNSLREGRIDGL